MSAVLTAPYGRECSNKHSVSSNYTRDDPCVDPTGLVLMDARETGVPDAHGSAESSLKQPVSKTRLEPDFRPLLKIPPSCRSSPATPPPSSAILYAHKKPTPSLQLYLTPPSPPSARLSPAHGHFLRQLLRVGLITPFSAGRRAASDGLSPPSCPPRRGRHVRCHRGRPRISA